jgi:hypothetical protein
MTLLEIERHIIRYKVLYLFFLTVVLPCIFDKFKAFLPTNAVFIKHKMIQLKLKISLYMTPTCFGPFGPSSGSIRQNLAKVTVFVENIVKNVAVLWRYVLQSVVCVLVAVTRRTAPSAHTTD